MFICEFSELRDPSDDSLHTSAAGSRGSTAPTTPVRNKEENGLDAYEDIAKLKIIQVAGNLFLFYLYQYAGAQFHLFARIKSCWD